MDKQKRDNLRRLHAAATPGEWRGTYYCKPDGSDIQTVEDVAETLAYSAKISPLAELFGVSIDDGKDICMTGNGPTSQANADYLAALHNAFPSLNARLEAAERERDELREESAYIKQQLEWVEENSDTYQKSALLDFLRRTLHGITHTATLREALAARDARMKKLGAAETLEDIAKDHGLDGGKAYMATVIYREFPDVLTMKVGVVDAADLMKKAARLRAESEGE